MSDKTNDIFIDGVANLSYNSGAFRFDLVSIDPTQKDGNDKPVINRQCRVVMTPQGYIQTTTALQNFLTQIEEKGIIRRDDVATEDAV